MPDSACPGPIATRQFLIKPTGMQPHSRNSESSEAFVSFEVALVFESCDLKDASGGGHLLACGQRRNLRSEKCVLGAACVLEEKEETPGRDDTYVPFGHCHEQERLGPS